MLLDDHHLPRCSHAACDTRANAREREIVRLVADMEGVLRVHAVGETLTMIGSEPGIRITLPCHGGQYRSRGKGHAGRLVGATQPLVWALCVIQPLEGHRDGTRTFEISRAIHTQTFVFKRAVVALG